MFLAFILSLGAAPGDAVSACERRLEVRASTALASPRQQVQSSLEALARLCPEALGELAPLARRAAALPRSERSRVLATSAASLSSARSLFAWRERVGLAPEVAARIDIGTFLFTAAAAQRGLGPTALNRLQTMLLAASLEGAP